MGKQANDSLFTMEDFRSYLRVWARTKGRGEFRKISQALKIHTTLISQILNGRKSLTEEQTSRLCDYMSLSTLESDYFLKLVQLDRAGTEPLKNIYRRHLKEIQCQSKEAKSRVPESKEMSKEDRAVFYSSWQYSLIRLMTSIDRFQTSENISSQLRLPISRVREILEFLTSRGLCKSGGRDEYKRTEKNTHVEARSPLAIRHHQNWRARSFEMIEKMTSNHCCPAHFIV